MIVCVAAVAVDAATQICFALLPHSLVAHLIVAYHPFFSLLMLPENRQNKKLLAPAAIQKLLKECIAVHCLTWIYQM
jgi:hypothetical protein